MKVKLDYIKINAEFANTPWLSYLRSLEEKQGYIEVIEVKGMYREKSRGFLLLKGWIKE
jgi:hypothetical protein